jgi:transposase
VHDLDHLTQQNAALVEQTAAAAAAMRDQASGKFAWPNDVSGTLTLSRPQLDALVLGLPWQRFGEAGVITLL